MLSLLQKFKGGKYHYVRTAFDSETKERMVIYQALYGEQQCWVRPEKMFFETVERDGRRFARFTELTEQREPSCSHALDLRSLATNGTQEWPSSDGRRR